MDKIAYGQHLKEHDSLVDPREYCPHCVSEVYRRTHRCHGDGSSSIGIQPRKEDEHRRDEDSHAIEPQPVPEPTPGKPVVKPKPKPVPIEAEPEPIEEP